MLKGLLLNQMFKTKVRIAGNPVGKKVAPVEVFVGQMDFVVDGETIGLKKVALVKQEHTTTTPAQGVAGPRETNYAPVSVVEVERIGAG